MNERDPSIGMAIPGVDLPDWLRPVADAAAGVKGSDLTRFLPPPAGGRASAVLMLLGNSTAPSAVCRVGNVTGDTESGPSSSAQAGRATC